MTDSTTSSTTTAQGNSVTTAFTYPFIIPSAAYAVITITDTTVTPNTVTALLPTQYHITGIGVATGGTVTYPLSGSPLAPGQYITISRIVPLVQTTSLCNQGPTFCSIEHALDYLTYITQQLQSEIAGLANLPAVTGGTVYIDNIAALRLNTTLYQTINVLGYYTPGDLGGGIMNYVSTDTISADDGSLIFVDASGHRYYRQVVNVFTLTMAGAIGNGSADDTTAVNNATRAALTHQVPLYIGPHTYKMTSSWNCTSGVGAQAGMTIIGSGVSSVIQFVYSGGANVNIKPGWDMTGAAYFKCADFTVKAGTTTLNCPRAALLLSAANSGGFVFGGLHVWNNVVLTSHGDFVVCNQGCEQIQYRDCQATGYSSAGTAVPFVYVAGLSDVLMTSPNATVFTPVASMTQVEWSGAKAVMETNADRMILVHYNRAGGAENIWHDGYMLLNNASSNPFILWGDDTGGAIASTALKFFGSRDAIIEATGSSGHMVVCKVTVPTVSDVEFNGRTSIGVDMADVQFQFTADPLSGWISWVANDASTVSAAGLVTCPSGGGLIIQTPSGVGLIPTGSNFAVTGRRALGGIVQNSDTNSIGSPDLAGPRGNNQFNYFGRIVAGPVTTGNKGALGVQTTQAVTGAGATGILSLQDHGQLVLVNGTNGSAIFSDLLHVTQTNLTEISKLTSAGAPTTRAYAIALGVLTLVLGAGTYNIQVTNYGSGLQG